MANLTACDPCKYEENVRAAAVGTVIELPDGCRDCNHALEIANRAITGQEVKTYLMEATCTNCGTKHENKIISGKPTNVFIANCPYCDATGCGPDNFTWGKPSPKKVE